MSDADTKAMQFSVPNQLLGLVACFAMCFAAAGLGAMVTTPEIAGWYASLAKPSWNPPAWLFGPVWTALYAMMALAVWLVWRRGPFRTTRKALLLFGAQLVLNIAWSWIFFNLHRPGLAVLEIVLLWSLILATCSAFARHSLLAASLMLPYLVWVGFAAILNLAIWQLN